MRGVALLLTAYWLAAAAVFADSSSPSAADSTRDSTPRELGLLEQPRLLDDATCDAMDARDPAAATRGAPGVHVRPPVPFDVSELPWIELEAPADAGKVGGRVRLVEVRGRAGTRGRQAVDVVLVFDLSESTLYPSGIDVDRDGVVGALNGSGVRNAFGTLRPTWTWTTDPDDTIVSAELEAARRLLRRLESSRTRVGLVSFAGRARELSDVGPVTEALETLRSIDARLDDSGTNLGSGIRAALRMLDRSSRRLGGGRRQAVIVLSDGRPTVPAPAIHARSYAISGAERARASGVRIYGYALGPQAAVTSVLEEVSLLTGGEYVEVAQVGDVVDHLPYVDFGGISEVQMRNRTAEVDGRAVRLFGDGSFDGFVPLEPGENWIEVGVTSEDGVSVRTLRSVYFDEHAVASRSPDELAQTLQRRTLETELAARMRAARVRRSRSVAVEVRDRLEDRPAVADPSAANAELPAAPGADVRD